MNPVILALAATITVADPNVRVEALDPSHHTALAHEIEGLRQRAAPGQATVQALPDGQGGAWLLVGRDGTLFGVDANNRVAWKREGVFRERPGSYQLMSDPESGFSVLVEGRQGVRILRLDSGGQLRQAIPVRAPELREALVATWPGRGWLIVWAADLQEGGSRLRYTLIGVAGDSAWGSKPLEIPSAPDSDFAMRHTSEDRYLLVWRGRDNPEQMAYLAQAITPTGTLAWPEAIEVASGRWHRRLDLRPTEGGMLVRTVGDVLTTCGSVRYPYEPEAVLVTPGGGVHPRAEERFSDHPPAWTGKHPLFGALPHREAWQRMNVGRRPLASRACTFDPVAGGFTAQGPRSLCGGPTPVIPAAPDGTIRLALGGRTIAVKDLDARGLTRWDPPMVGYASTQGAVHWRRDEEGVRAWVLFEALASPASHAFEILEPYRLRARDGAAEIVDEQGALVATVALSGLLPWGVSPAKVSLRVSGRRMLLEVEPSGSEPTAAVGVSWLPGSAMARPRTGAVALHRRDGRIALVGGTSWPIEELPDEVFDSDTGTWSSAPPLPGPGMINTRAVDAAGQVYAVVGPWTSSRVPAHLVAWDPGGTWRHVAMLPGLRSRPLLMVDERTTAWVREGRLMIQELDSEVPREVAIPASALIWHLLVLDSNRILVQPNAFGAPRSASRASWTYRWREDRWELFAQAPREPCGKGPRRLSDGRFLYPCGAVWVIDPRTGEDTPVPVGPGVTDALELRDGRVIVLRSGAAEIWNPRNGRVQVIEGGAPAADATLVEAPDGKVWLLGGGAEGELRTRPWVVDLEAGMWRRP